MHEKSPELKTAIQAALKAGEILERHQGTDIVRGIKEDKSMVTLADRESEELIKKIILEKFPSHGIVGEETDSITNASPYVWYIDPIDGSRNFAHSIPFYAVSISLIKGKEIIVGVVYNSASRSLFYAEKGKGAYLNDKPIHISKSDHTKCIVTVASGRQTL